MLLFRPAVFHFRPLTLCFGTLDLSLSVASRILSPQAFLLGPQPFLFRQQVLAIGVSLFLFEPQLEVLDLGGSLEPLTVPSQCLPVFLFGALVFTRGSLLLPVSSLSLMLYALPCFGNLGGVLFALCESMLGLLELSSGSLAISFGLGVNSLRMLTLRISPISFDIGPSPFRFYLGLDLLGAVAFGSKLTF